MEKKARLLYKHINRYYKSILDSEYDDLFKEHNARAGMLNLINTGNSFINGFPVPSNEDEAHDGMTVNGEKIFRKLDSGKWTWAVHPIFRDHTGCGLDFDEARLALIDAASRLQGLSVELWDTDDDGYADMFTTTLKGGGQVYSIEEHGDNVALTGMLGYGGDDQKPIHLLTVKSRNVSGSIEPYDLVLHWWQNENGSEIPYLERAVPVKGYFTEVTGNMPDEKNVVNGVLYDQALIARHFMTPDTRNSQFWEKHREQTGRPVIMWTTEYGFPFGFTYLYEQ